MAWHGLLTSDLFVALVDLLRLPQTCLLHMYDTPVGLWDPGLLQVALDLS